MPGIARPMSTALPSFGPVHAPRAPWPYWNASHRATVETPIAMRTERVTSTGCQRAVAGRRIAAMPV